MTAQLKARTAAQEERRVVLTADTDFGELVFRSRLSAECGVILVWLDWSNPAADNQGDDQVGRLLAEDARR